MFFHPLENADVSKPQRTAALENQAQLWASGGTWRRHFLGGAVAG